MQTSLQMFEVLSASTKRDHHEIDGSPFDCTLSIKSNDEGRHTQAEDRTVVLHKSSLTLDDWSFVTRTIIGAIRMLLMP